MAIARTLVADGRVDVLLVEPHLRSSPIDGCPLVAVDEALERANLAVVLVAHRRFRGIDTGRYEGLETLDCVGLWS
jgi:UDP-N-acetyl-D-mannosaminuronate dehydrogenase